MAKTESFVWVLVANADPKTPCGREYPPIFVHCMLSFRFPIKRELL